MSNMRGRGFEPAGPQQRLIEMLRNGQTYGQLQKERLRRTALGLTMGGINLVGGLMQGSASEEQADNNKKRDKMANAIASQTAQDRENRKAPGDYKPYDDGSKAPAWLGEDGRGATGHTYNGFPTEPSATGDEPFDLSLRAQDAIDRQKQADKGLLTGAGGYHTTDGLELLSRKSDAQNKDLATGKSMIGQGGMMNSLPRVERNDLTNPQPPTNLLDQYDPVDDVYGRQR